MVNAPEADIRANRLNLLLQLAELMNRVILAVWPVHNRRIPRPLGRGKVTH